MPVSRIPARIARLAGTILLTAIVAVLAMSWILAQYQRADVQRRAQTAVANIEHDVDAVRYYPATYLYGQPVGASAVATESHLATGLVADARALRDLAPTSSSRRIERLSSALAAQGQGLIERIRDHRADAAINNTRTLQPAADTLAALLPRESRNRAHAATDERTTANRVTVVALLGVAMLNAALTLGFARHRRRAARAAAEQRATQDTSTRFEHLLAHSWDVIVVIGEDLRVSYASPAVKRVLGISPDALLGAHLESFVHPDDLARVWASAPKRGEPMASRWRHADGRWIDVESVYTDLTGDPHVLGYVNNVRDVTLRNELERELRRSQRLESVGQLASGIAHEINTPVQFVGDNLQFIEDAVESLFAHIHRHATPSAPEGRPTRGEEGTEDLTYLQIEVPAALRDARDGIDRIANIVRAMRSVGHPDGATQAPADVNESLRATLTIAQHEIKQVADVECDLNELPSVRCFRGELNQVFLNLLINAAHAIGDRQQTCPGRGTIRVSSRHVDDHVLIEIGDTGTGIPHDIGDRVFDHFFTTKEVGKGTGQGLALARSIVVDRHHGNITFETLPGVGTSFFVRLPVTGLLTTTTPNVESGARTP